MINNILICKFLILQLRNISLIVDSAEEERYYIVNEDMYSNSFYGVNGDEITTITFTNKKPSGNYYLDISENQDKSILLYKEDTNVVIYSNNKIIHLLFLHFYILSKFHLHLFHI